MAKSSQLEGILSRATTTTPKAAPAPAAEVVQLETAKAPEPAKPAKAEKFEKPKPATASPEPQKSVQAYVPASVDRALRMRAAEEGTTTRNLILQGLKAIGFDVPEAEMRDKRGKS